MMFAAPMNHASSNGSTPLLRISSTLGLPHRAVTEAIAVVGRRGSGKTNFGVVLVEELVTAHLPVCVVDPVGVWWGLRAGPEKEKGGGLPIVLLGGERGDVPLEPESGRVIADFILDVGQPCILDVSLMSNAEQLRFMADFAERLYHAKARRRDALHLVIDEADAYAPQKPSERGGHGPRLLGAMEALVRRGRSRGIGMTMITQRPAVLNKNLLTQAEVLVVFQLTSPQDRKALEAWVNANAESEAQVKAFTSALPTLMPGHAFVWSPQWLKTFEAVHVRKRKTYDSSRTPEPGERSLAARELAPVDLEALKERIADSIERAEENDPEVLHRKIGQLEAELAAARAIPRNVEVRVPVVPPAVLAAAVRLRERLGLIIDDAKAIIAASGDDQPLSFIDESPRSKPAMEGYDVPLEEQSPALAAIPAAGEEKIETGARKILTALAQRSRPVPKRELALLTQYTAGGGRFNNLLGWLRTRQYVAGSDTLEITIGGRKALGSYERMPTGRALLEYWIANAGGRGEGKILAIVAAAYPRKLSKAVLAEKANYTAGGGRFNNILGRLRTLRLVEGKRELGLSRELVAAAGLG